MANMKKFNERMSKLPKYSKGGMIRKIAGVHYFSGGGPATTTSGLVGGISNFAGLNNQFQAQGANITPGTNAVQLATSYQGAQSGINQQQNLANQVQPGTQQGLATQQALTGQLQGVVAGTGPNAAQTALAQNTAANVNQQAALMAGQRGASANAGLIARQNAQTGAAQQQAAVGQGASLQAQQQIAAQQQLAGLAQTQVGQGAAAIQGVNNTQQNEQNILQGANTSANNANVAMQSNINNANSAVSMANQQEAGQVVGGLSALVGNVPAVSGLFAKGGEVKDMAHHCAGAHCTDRAHYKHLFDDGGWVSSTPDTDVPDSVSTNPIAPPAAKASGGGSSIGAIAGLAALLARGGEVDRSYIEPLVVNPAAPLGQQGVGQWINSAPNTAAPAAGASAPNVPTIPAAPAKKEKPAEPKPEDPIDTKPNDVVGSSQAAGGANSAGEGDAVITSDTPVAAAKGGSIDNHVANFLSGGSVPAKLSPGEIYLSPSDVHKVVKEGANPLKIGMKVPGKAKKPGKDSYDNDTFSADLEEGGCVLPLHIMKHKDPEKAELFVHRAMHMRNPEKGKK